MPTLLRSRARHEVEHTLGAPVEFSGIGLHSGAPVTMKLSAAPAGAGIVFRRTDLDSFVIEATARNVAKVSYATSLMKQGVLISTTEHLLSALVGSGVDNVFVDLDNLELPILDGSAQPYIEAFQRVKVQPQRRRRQYLKVLKPIAITDGSKQLSIEPADNFTVEYEIDFPTPIGRQQCSVDLTESGYMANIAAARTFGFKEDEPMLRNMGLIRGVSESSAIILNRERVLNGPLRFDDEFVRHKVLDLIGDLALAGHRLLGRVRAVRAGHAMHTALVSRLLGDRSAWELVTREAAQEARPSARRAASLSTASA